MSESQIIHVKLNKLLYGNNQHIFKTTMNVKTLSSINNVSATVDDSEITQKNSYNTILYSSFTPGTDSNEYQLYDFDEINFTYKDNESIQNLNTYLNNISDFFKTYFYKYLNYTDNKQNIYYFKQITNPIDIINVNNTAYFLSKLQTIKNIEILEQESLISNKGTVVKATNKKYYQSMYNYLINRALNYSENNTIPIYDLEYNFIDTVNLNTYENLCNWINTNNFSAISSNFVYINENYNNYCINIHHLLKILYTDSQYMYKYNKSLITDILIDLLSYIPKYTSINKYNDKYGVISKLNKDYISIVKNNKSISAIFNDYPENIKQIFNKIYIDNYNVNDIPQNTLYISNLNENISIPKNIEDIKWNKISANINFLNLKNQQTPEYDYDIQLPSTLYDVINYQQYTTYVTLTESNNILSNKNNKKITIQLNEGNYYIEFISGIFYTNAEKYIVYKNNFGFSFFPYGITQVSSQITDIINKKFEQDYIPESAAISSHIYQAAINYKKIQTSPGTLNNEIYKSEPYIKARGIDWNIPSSYIFNIDQFNNEKKTQPWIKEYDGNNKIIKTYFPKGITYITNENNKNLLLSDFSPSIQMDTKMQPPYGQAVYADFKITKAKQNIYFYFNSIYNIIGSCTFKIDKKYNENVSNKNLEQQIDNYDRMILFEADKNKSYSFNTQNISETTINNYTYKNPIRSIVNNILSTASQLDEQAARINKEYEINYPERLKEKTNNYITSQFNEFHIENNRCPQVGCLNGLRIYKNIGKTSDDILWTTYKYLTTNSDNILNILSYIQESPYKAYNISRFSKNMQKTNYRRYCI